MSLEQVIGYLDQILAVEDILSVCFTGGEVFTVYDLLRSSVREAGRRGLASRLVTNGFWATTVEKAREKLLPLVDNGLITVNVSYDKIHEGFIDRSRVQNVVHAALELDVEVVVAHLTLGGSAPETVGQILSELEVSSESNISMVLGQVNPSGRAAENYSLEQLGVVDVNGAEGERMHDVCNYVVRDPAITPDGNLTACCGTTVTNPDGFCREFVVGNLNERSLVELLEEMEYDPLFTALMIEGPWYLYHQLCNHDPDLLPRHRFVHVCDLCAQVVRNERARKVLLKIVEEQELQLQIKKMMLETARQEKLAAEESSD